VNQKGAASIFGLLAIFAATAVVITVVMLLVTGVAQRAILPRLKQRAQQAVPPLRSQVRLEQTALAEQASELEDVIAEWKRLRSVDDTEAAKRIAAMAKLYSNMKPEAAARVLVRLDDETFAKVLAKIDKRQAGKILSLIDPERVARLTERAAQPEYADAS
jgi:flagellar motility protein MotE (MotC chaperone)